MDNQNGYSPQWVYWVLPLLVLFFVTSAFADPPSTSAAPLVLEIATPFPGSMLYVPNDGKSHPGIILLHGSEGGSLVYYRLEAQMLAMHGYSVLAFCWYNCAQNPIVSPYQPLEDIELNKTINALNWLKKSPHVAGKKTAIFGFSRGAEQTLILGWKMAGDKKNRPDALVVHAPSDIVVSGLTWTAMDSRCWLCTSFDLACFRNSRDPAQWDLANVRWNQACGEMPKDPAVSPKNAWLLNGVPLTSSARIEIEKFEGPIFITHGTVDEWWESDRTVRIKDALEKAGRTPEVHLFKGERHNFSPENENKRRELTLRFLQKNLN